MKVYYVQTGMGATLVEASTENAARSIVLREVGTYNGIQVSRLATDEDIQWVNAMCGGVPDTPRTRKLLAAGKEK